MNERHPIRHFFTKRRIQDEYAMRKGTPSPIFMKTIDKFGELGVDTRIVKTTSSYKRASWMIDAYKCLQIVAECTATLEGKYNKRLKIFTDGSLKDERVGYVIFTPVTTIKNRMNSQTTIFSAEQ
jgi:hypothetical protein